MEALRPFRVPLQARPAADPQPLPYLRADLPITARLDLKLEVFLSTARMRAIARSSSPQRRQSSRSLLDLRADDCPSHQQRLQSRRRRPDRQWNCFWPRENRHEAACLKSRERGAAPIQSSERRDCALSSKMATKLFLRDFARGKAFPRISLGECRGRFCRLPGQVDSRPTGERFFAVLHRFRLAIRIGATGKMQKEK